jgi:hypothetical protein
MPSVATAPTTPAGIPALPDLPRREPMANIVPQLRASRTEVPKGPVAGRNPEQARAAVRYQDRLAQRRGREQRARHDVR